MRTHTHAHTDTHRHTQVLLIVKTVHALGMLNEIEQ
jgi:hypothetical protein